MGRSQQILFKNIAIMAVYILVFIIYLSFVFDLIIWPIPSEASTKALMSFDNQQGIVKSCLLILVFLLNFAFFIFPLIASVRNIIYNIEPEYARSIFGLFVSALGRFISLKGTLTLRQYTCHKLVTQSIFKVSRNPISTGMHLTIFGLILVFNNWYLWIGFVLYFLNIHFKIKIEEKHLMDIYGPDYQLYKSKTNRYLTWLILR
jgi:protein-S-isoprenylcysteine O-methyltransferase Ste14